MVAIGWSKLEDLTEMDSEEIRRRFEKKFPEDGPRAVGLKVGYIDRLVNKMKEGDTDLIAKNLPGDVTIRIQVKHYARKPLEGGPVNQLSKSMSESDVGIVPTVGDIADSAVQKADESDYEISLIDGWTFTELVFDHRADFSRDELQLLGFDALAGLP